MALSFYLLAEPPTTDQATAMVALPQLFTVEETDYILVAAVNTDAQHEDLIAEQPQPAGWTGSVGDALALLVAASCNHLWWVFDSFVHRQGIAASGEYRNF